jgi:pyruvate ferredoxin oxidoreductase alpha subunit
MDKCEAFSGIGGPVFGDVRSACYELEKRPHIINYIYGLGGRDVRVDDFTFVFDELAKVISAGKTGEIYRHVGVRGV